MPNLSRRALLAGVSTTAVLETTRPFRSLAETRLEEIRIGTGRINLGLAAPTDYSFFHPFINIWKIARNMTVGARSGKGGTSEEHWQSSTPPGSALSPWGVYLDSDGELINPLPPNFLFMNRLFYTGPSTLDELPGYTRIGERWVLKWDGGPANAAIWGGVSSQRQIGNRVEWVWSSDTNHHKLVVFEKVDLQNPPRNIRLFEARLEARLDAGEIFNPDWLAQIRRAAGIVRFMDWAITNHNFATRRVSDIPTEHYLRWGGESATVPGVKSGMPLSVMTKLCRASHTHAWVSIPHMIGVDKAVIVTKTSNTNPIVVHAPGHNFVNGDSVLFTLNGSRELLGKLLHTLHSVSNADNKSGTFELSGIDATRIPTGGNGLAFQKYDLDRIATEVALLAAHFRNEMSQVQLTYFEFSNETWNPGFSQHSHLATQGTASGFRGFRANPNLMAGYLAAHCMKVIRDAYGVDNRKKWKGVLPTQTVSIGVTNVYLEGIKHYIKTHAPTLSVRDLFDDLAVAGYWGGILFHSNRSTGSDGKSNTCTFTIASPCVVRWTWHGMSNNAPIKFSTTGSLPTGVAAGTIYFVKNRTDHTFEIAASQGGPAIATSGRQEGVHTPTYAIKDLTDQWINDSIARFEKGLEPTKYSYWDRMINEDLRDGRHAGAGGFSLVDVEAYWLKQKAIADAHGLGLIQYEGGNHAILGQHLHQDARYLEFYARCNHTAEDSANYTEMFRRFVAIGGRYPCKFVDFSPAGRFGAWGGLRWMSGTAMDKNPVWDAVVAFNNAP
jgi:hypothetical protein